MPRINPVDHQAADGAAKDLLDGVKAQIGMVPNIFATLVQSPSVLEGFLAFSGALGKGALSAQLREQIALTVAGANNCNYCASAHTAIGKGAGIGEAELRRNLEGRSDDSRTQAVLDFVRKSVDQRGQVRDDEVQALREAGLGDGEIVEVVANIGVNLFTNYFNHIARTEIDFPVVDSTAVTRAA